jgi:hypothetical protein
MKNSERFAVYGIGFVMGMILVWMILMRRELREDTGVDPWVAHNAAAVEEGAEPIPEGMAEPILKGRIIGFGTLPSEAAPQERVWLLSFEESYPFVRAVEDIETGQFRYMAADQICIRLREGNDVTALKPMLAELDLRMRMFNRAESLAVISVLSSEIDGVPATLEAVQPWSHLFETAYADELRFQPRPNNL